MLRTNIVLMAFVIHVLLIVKPVVIIRLVLFVKILIIWMLVIFVCNLVLIFIMEVQQLVQPVNAFNVHQAVKLVMQLHAIIVIVVHIM